MSPTDQIQNLLAQLRRPGGPLPADFTALVTELLALLEQQPGGKHFLEALIKPGSSRDVPVRSASPDTPIFVKLPCAIDFVNVPPAALQPQLKPVAEGFGSKITVYPQLQN